MKIETLEKLKLWVSPVTRVIYLGTTKMQKGREVATGDKRDVTVQVLNAAAEHLGETGTVAEFDHGTLMFVPKEEQGFTLTAEEVKALAELVPALIELVPDFKDGLPEHSYTTGLLDKMKTWLQERTADTARAEK